MERTALLVGSVWKTGTIVAVHAETASARVVEIEVPDWPGNLAGQHLDLRLTADDGYTATRSYSLASSGAATRIQLAIDKVPDGEVSPYLVDVAEVGDLLEIRGPLGGWFVWEPDDAHAVQLIGGGSGIVPLMAMIRAHQAIASPVEFQLMYSVRTPDDAIFSDELRRLDAESRNLTVRWVYTRKAPDGWPEPTGRVTKELVDEATLTPASHPTVFVCGPTGFVEAVADILVALGHDPAVVKTERFGGA